MPLPFSSPRWLPLLAAIISMGCTVVVSPGVVPTPSAVATAAATAGPTQVNSPRIAESTAPNPSPTPAAIIAPAASLVALSGFVLGDAGVSQPIGGALVVAGAVSSKTALPTEDAVVEEAAAETQAAALRGRGVTGPTVRHDFGDGKGPVLAELRKRQHWFKFTQNADIYLRSGEFFLEGIPEGEVNVSASFGAVTGSSTRLFAPGGHLVADVTLRISLPEPLVAEGGLSPKVVELVSMAPATGVAVAVKVLADGEIELNYRPDASLVMTFAAPPGSAGATIAGVQMTYEYATPARQIAGEPSLSVGPFELPVESFTVPAAVDLAYGSHATLTVNLAREELKAIFGNNEPSQQPGIVIAKLTFVDAEGHAVVDRNLQNLTVSAAIRAL